MKILANDGISNAGISLLEQNGFEVITTKVTQEQVANFINTNNISVLLVRSATKAKKDIIDACPNLKIIGRGGVGMDNIDVAYAKEKGIKVINTPASSSQSVAELVFAHLFSGVRFLHDSNRNMPLDGDTKFDQLKKAYADGIELKGKTLGIIGIGRIGQAVAEMAIGLGMKVIFYDKFTSEVSLKLTFFNETSTTFYLKTNTFEEVIQQSDFITLHVPAQESYVIGEKEFASMKDGVGIVNAARGGIIDEIALLKFIKSGKVLFAGLDVFESEPKPEIQILMQPKISLTPHIGAATLEAQDRIGTELANQIIEILK
jgi:D-3-phosphoglycerate dehydrogenase